MKKKNQKSIGTFTWRCFLHTRFYQNIFQFLLNQKLTIKNKYYDVNLKKVVFFMYFSIYVLIFEDAEDSY